MLTWGNNQVEPRRGKLTLKGKGLQSLKVKRNDVGWGLLVMKYDSYGEPLRNTYLREAGKWDLQGTCSVQMEMLFDSSPSYTYFYLLQLFGIDYYVIRA